MENRLREIIENNRYLTEKGKVADYIPALSKADPNHIGLCLIDSKGNIYKAGNFDTKFTIQSISKVLSLLLAILDKGEENVFNKVGYMGTDEPFNTMYKLDLPYTIKPPNPMINAGAIVTTSLVKGKGDEKFNRILELVRKVTENPNLDYNREVYLSEKATGDKNRALAYIMKARGMIEGDVEEILDVYFKQCSIEVDVTDLARIGIFLARGCKTLLSEEIIGNSTLSSLIISIMATCGMYDFSGEYAAKVGVPSKSGVAGGIMAAVPNKFGIGVYSPGLDIHGNSYAGYGIMRELSDYLNLSLYK